MSNELFLARIYSPSGEIKTFIDFEFNGENIFSGIFVIFGKRLTISDGRYNAGKRSFSVELNHGKKTTCFEINVELKNGVLTGSVENESNEPMPIVGGQYFQNAAYLGLG